jgi:hypothetical protein
MFYTTMFYTFQIFVRHLGPYPHHVARDVDQRLKLFLFVHLVTLLLRAARQQTLLRLYDIDRHLFHRAVTEHGSDLPVRCTSMRQLDATQMPQAMRRVVARLALAVGGDEAKLAGDAVQLVGEDCLFPSDREGDIFG